MLIKYIIKYLLFVTEEIKKDLEKLDQVERIMSGSESMNDSEFFAAKRKCRQIISGEM